MTLSAEFTVEGSSSVTAHQVAFGATVDLALLSFDDVSTIAWSIAGTSHSSMTTPTITSAGSPTGATASFAMPADPGDNQGRSVLVKCLVTDSRGQTATAYRVVGAVNGAGRVPFATGEENYRNATHGWTDDINAAFALNDVSIPLTIDHNSSFVVGTIQAGGTDAEIVRWGVNGNDWIEFGDANYTAVLRSYVETGGSFSWVANATTLATLSASSFAMTSVPIALGSTVSSTGDIRGHNTFLVAVRNNANGADVDLIQKTSADLVVIGDSTDASGVEIKTKTGTTVIVDVAGTDVATFSGSLLTTTIPLIQTEAGSAPTVNAGQGGWWTENTAPSRPMFKDDTGNSFPLGPYEAENALTGASNTLSMAALGKRTTVSHGSATQLTVPPNSDVAYAVGTILNIAQIGAGQVEIVQGSGVTVNVSATYTRFLREQWSQAQLWKQATNTWLLTGDLDPA